MIITIIIFKKRSVAITHTKAKLTWIISIPSKTPRFNKNVKSQSSNFLTTWSKNKSRQKTQYPIRICKMCAWAKFNKISASLPDIRTRYPPGTKVVIHNPSNFLGTKVVIMVLEFTRYKIRFPWSQKFAWYTSRFVWQG